MHVKLINDTLALKPLNIHFSPFKYSNLRLYSIVTYYFVLTHLLCLET